MKMFYAANSHLLPRRIILRRIGHNAAGTGVVPEQAAARREPSRALSSVMRVCVRPRLQKLRRKYCVQQRRVIDSRAHDVHAFTTVNARKLPSPVAPPPGHPQMQHAFAPTLPLARRHAQQDPKMVMRAQMIMQEEQQAANALPRSDVAAAFDAGTLLARD